MSANINVPLSQEGSPLEIKYSGYPINFNIGVIQDNNGVREDITTPAIRSYKISNDGSSSIHLDIRLTNLPPYFNQDLHLTISWSPLECTFFEEGYYLESNTSFERNTSYIKLIANKYDIDTKMVGAIFPQIRLNDELDLSINFGIDEY